ncbi:MAG: hypothetical protein ACU0BS_13035 [Hasllibacter sp.]
MRIVAGLAVAATVLSGCGPSASQIAREQRLLAAGFAPGVAECVRVRRAPNPGAGAVTVPGSVLGSILASAAVSGLAEGISESRYANCLARYGTSPEQVRLVLDGDAAAVPSGTVVGPSGVARTVAPAGPCDPGIGVMQGGTGYCVSGR